MLKCFRFSGPFIFEDGRSEEGDLELIRGIMDWCRDNLQHGWWAGAEYAFLLVPKNDQDLMKIILAWGEHGWESTVKDQLSCRGAWCGSDALGYTVKGEVGNAEENS